MTKRTVGQLFVGVNPPTVNDDVNIGNNGVLRIYKNTVPPAAIPDTVAFYSDGDKVFVINESGAVIEVGSGGGGPSLPPVDFDFTFNYNDTTPFIIRGYNSGDILKEVVLAVTTSFDGGAGISIGFPGDQEAVAPASHIELADQGSLYKFNVYKTFTSSQSLRIYSTGGTPTQGQIRVYVKEG